MKKRKSITLSIEELLLLQGGTDRNDKKKIPPVKLGKGDWDTIGGTVPPHD